MTFSRIGGMTLGSAFPAVATAQANLSASVNIPIPDLNARLAALVSASVNMPPLSAAALAQIVAAISGGFPSVTISAAAIADVIIEIQDTLAALQAQASFALALGGALSAGVHLYRWSGPASEAVPGGVPGLPGDSNVDGVFLVAGNGTAWSSLQFLLGE